MNANKYHEQNNIIWTRALCCCIGDYRNSHSFWCSVLHIFRNGYIFIEQKCKDTRSILSSHQSEKCLNRAQCCLNIKLYHKKKTIIKKRSMFKNQIFFCLTKNQTLCLQIFFLNQKNSNSVITALNICYLWLIWYNKMPKAQISASYLSKLVTFTT